MTKVANKSEIVYRLRGAESQLRKLGVRRLALFGSFARDEAVTESDVDFLVEFAPGQKSFDTFMALSFLLEDLMQRPVELVTREALSPYIGEHILREAEDIVCAA
jgi:uncharacterized protein